jgi:phosphoribosyl 1,2-cyclic phosphodiesterase
MLVSVLASGSKGNVTLIKTKNHNFLIDAGTNVKYISDALKKVDTSLDSIEYIFLTHTHTDHTSSLNNMIKKYHPIIVLTKLMYDDLSYLSNYDNIIFLEEDLDIDDVKVQSIKTSHDTSDSRGYIIIEGNSSVVNITDTGYLNQKFFPKLQNKNLYIMESNHNVEMLIHGKYPKWLQKRILSDVGHLSNEASSYYLSKIIGQDTKCIILAHLSEENNDPDLALETINDTFKENEISFCNIIVAKQNEQTELINI